MPVEGHRRRVEPLRQPSHGEPFDPILVRHLGGHAHDPVTAQAPAAPSTVTHWITSLGVCTLVPTARRLPIDRPAIRTASSAEGLIAQAGPLARTTADVELALQVMVDAIAARPTGSNPPVPWRNRPESGVAGLRVAVLPAIDGFAPSPAIRRAIDEAAAALGDAGATVEAWDPAPDTSEAIAVAMQVWTADGGAWARQLLDGEAPHPLIKGALQATSLPNPMVRALAAILKATGQRRLARLARNAQKGSARELLDRLGDRLAYEEAFLAAMDAGGYDLVLGPATPLPAVPHGVSAKLADVESPSALFNMLGMPGGVVPVTRVRPGEESDRPASKDATLRAARRAEQGTAVLPVAVQVVARHWREDLVLAAMAAIEAEAISCWTGP